MASQVIPLGRPRNESGIGAAISRVDGVVKVTGAAAYAADYPVPGLLYAALVSATIPKGRIRAIDASAALALPGVVTVLTHENRPKVARTSLGYFDMLSPPGWPFKPLHDARVRFDGQPVALVVADSYEAARDAVALVKVDYEHEPHCTDLALAKPYKPLLPAFGAPRPPKPRGDALAAFDAAAVKIAATYHHAPEHHQPMELCATTVMYDPEDGGYTVYDKTQGPQNVRSYLARATRIKRKKLRVVNAFVGGAFGVGLRPFHATLLAVLAAKALSRSVRLVLTRPQMFALGYRPDTIQTVELACDANGVLAAIRHEALAATSSYESLQENVVNWSGLLYRCDNVDLRYRVAALDTVTPAAMRAPGGTIGQFALETAMDELAHAGGFDPLALRLRNHVDHDQNTGKRITAKALRACYEVGADRFGWGDRTPAPGSMLDGSELVGFGMASGVWEAQVAPISVKVRASVDRDGHFEIATASSDIGTGTYTVLAQIAADVLGVDAWAINVRLGDSDLPFNMVQGGSITAASTGAATRNACAQLLEALTRLATRAGIGSADVVSNAAAILRAVGKENLAVVGGSGGSPFKGRGQVSYTHSAVFAEVRIHRQLGVLRVERIVSAVAAGRILNPKMARSQILGGIVMGIGQALHEEAVTDHRSGRIMTRNLADYHFPANADIRELDVVFVDDPDPESSPLGVKGLGEIGVVGVAAAIGNAVFHATGKRIRRLPITIDRIRETSSVI